MSDEASALAPGTVLAGKFRVVRCLGQGGMGAVYEIEHELTKHRRALKLLHASMAAMPGVVERFLREASAAGRVGNPHIVESFDAGRLDTGEPYLVLEMLRGQTLTDRIAGGPMALAEMVDLLGQACDGIQAAHDAGIVHRDLKPDNLFVSDVNGRPFVKILDFGISKFDPSKTGGMQLTQEGAALGTPYYMSPEQVMGLTNLDSRADIYALGVILYECAASSRPFEADTLPHLVVKIHEGQPKPLAEWRPDLPREFCDLVHHAMAKNRDHRLQTARELRSALQRFGRISVDTHLPMSLRSDAPPVPTEVPPGLRDQHAAGASVVGAASAIAAQSAVAAQSALSVEGLATSAAGVSMRTPTPKKTNTGLIVGAAIGGVVLLVGGVFVVRSHNGHNAGGSESASAEIAGQPSNAAAAQGSTNIIEPLVPTDTTSSASAAASNTPPRQTPTAEQNSASPQRTKTASSAATTTTATPPATQPHKHERADQTGLAKENPFK